MGGDGDEGVMRGFLASLVSPGFSGETMVHRARAVRAKANTQGLIDPAE